MKKLLLLIAILIIAALLAFWFYPTKKPDLSKYSDPDYAKHVELQAYLMTSDQVANLFASNPNGTPNHWTINDAPKLNPNPILAKNTSYFEPIYLVIRMKNTGTRYVWGELTCKFPTGGSADIQILSLRPNEEKFQNLVQRVFSGGILYDSLKPENPQAKWKQIYTKPKEPI